MSLREVVERKWKVYAFILGMSLLFVLLDYLNPFVNFFKTWNFHYVVNNLVEYMCFLIPIFFFLGFISEWDDSDELFLACFWIPLFHYLFRGLLFLWFIALDPNLPHVIGAWYGGYILDWRDFSLIYFFTTWLFMWGVWRYSIGFLALGRILSYLFGKRITSLVKNLLSRRIDGSGDGPVGELMV
jgi:hypothetical protein